MMKTMARYAAKAAAGLLPAAVVARLGMPALGALVLVGVLLLGLVCWVIGNQDRTDRASQILLACRGAVGPQLEQAPPPAGMGMRRRALQLVTSRKSRVAR